MIGRAPNLQKPREDFYSGDPAFIQLPELADDATPEAFDAHKKLFEEHKRKWEIARETGDYSALRVEGGEPTVFLMRPLLGEAFRKLADKLSVGELLRKEAAQLAFRIAISDVVGFGVPVKAGGKHIVFGPMATVDITNALDAVDHRIVTELGTEALNRAMRISPKP